LYDDDLLLLLPITGTVESTDDADNAVACLSTTVGRCGDVALAGVGNALCFVAAAVAKAAAFDCCFFLLLLSPSLKVLMKSLNISQSPKFMFTTLLRSSMLQLKRTRPFRFCAQMAEQ
jgi:hypothetical protein